MVRAAVIRKHREMATSGACTTSTEPSPGFWTVEQLKIYLKEKELPVSGQKNELVKRVVDFQEAEALQAELGAVAFQNLSVPAALPFEGLPNSGWSIGELPQVTEERAIAYLKRLGGFTKNYRTGVRLCQCGHIYDIEGAPSGSRMYVRAKCRPTMRKQSPFYKLFVTIAWSVQLEGPQFTVEGANCYCAAGETQSRVHVTALLFTLAEVSPAACTSLPCAWSRPSAVGGISAQSSTLDFGKASSEGYLPHSGPRLDVRDLLRAYEMEGIRTGVGMYVQQEEDRCRTLAAASSTSSTAATMVLTDPLDRLAEKDITNVTVDYLISALHVTPEKVKLLETMTAGQRHNPLWMDARQWRVTASNFGKVCNRHREPGYYPPFLLKLLLGDYGTPVSAPLQWGIAHEDIALQAYAAQVERQVDPCGIFISCDHPFLGASPDGIVFNDGNEMGLVEVKCPYKHREHTLEEACKDKVFHLHWEKGEPRLKKTHDYYFQVTGQLGITGAAFCDFVTWTCNDMHVEGVPFDGELWGHMIITLTDFYRTALAPEIIDRLIVM